MPFFPTLNSYSFSTSVGFKCFLLKYIIFYFFGVPLKQISSIYLEHWYSVAKAGNLIHFHNTEIIQLLSLNLNIYHQIVNLFVYIFFCYTCFDLPVFIFGEKKYKALQYAERFKKSQFNCSSIAKYTVI